VWNTAAARLNLFTKGSRHKASSLVFFEWTEAELVRSTALSDSLFGNILAQHGLGGAWPRFAWRVLILAQHGMGGTWPWLRLEGAGFWLSMALVEPGHA